MNNVKLNKKETKKMIEFLNNKARYALQNMMFAIEHNLPVEEQFRNEAKVYFNLRNELMRSLWSYKFMK